MDKQATIPTRAAGILLPASSLPSPYGIGSFGKAAYNWVNFLASAGQQYWQVLPLGPTSYGDSPYQSFSAFAGNPYFIDLDLLREDGLLHREDYAGLYWGSDETSVDYEALYTQREAVLRKAFARFDENADLGYFYNRHKSWLEDYALYMAVKATQNHRAWPQWDLPLRQRHPAALAQCRRDLAGDIRYHIFVQYQFFRQWHALRAHAAEKGVQIIGDIPIYVSMDSADVWANRALFQLDENGVPPEVAGCPPDGFSADGQLWGNPLYRWDVMERDGFAWWMARVRASFELYDVLRIDHFRGLESYYSIPYRDATARGGKWVQGPGMRFIQAIRATVPQARIIAEDLGFLTNGVRQLLAESGYPGMKVLQFAFDTREESDYSPYNYTYNSVVYTGTHDNDTVLGWAENAPPEDVRLAMDYLGVNQKEQLPMAFIRLALGSHSGLAVVPMQDWLALGSTARMNIPSTIGGRNWRWRLAQQALAQQLARQIRHLSQVYGRHTPGETKEDTVPKADITLL